MHIPKNPLLTKKTWTKETYYYAQNGNQGNLLLWSEWKSSWPTTTCRVKTPLLTEKNMSRVKIVVYKSNVWLFKHQMGSLYTSVPYK